MQVRHVANSANGRLTGQEAGQEARKTEQMFAVAVMLQQSIIMTHPDEFRTLESK